MVKRNTKNGKLRFMGLLLVIGVISFILICSYQNESTKGKFDFSFIRKHIMSNTFFSYNLKPTNVCLNTEFSPKYSVSIWTMLTDNKNYVLGAIKLGLSVVRHSTIPVDMVILELKSNPLSDTNWTKLYRVGWKKCVVNRIGPPDERNVFPRFRDQYTKLHLWRMTYYNTVVYFDSDALVIGNIDKLLKTDLKSYSIGVSRDIMAGKWLSTFNMGVFVLHPNQTEYEGLIQLKNNGTVKFDQAQSEQGFLNTVYKATWFEIGFIYNANLAAYSQKQEHWKKMENDIRVIHYTMNKPWECGGVYLNVCKLWTNANGL